MARLVVGFSTSSIVEDRAHRAPFSVLHKTPNYLIEVPAQPHLADALRDMGVLSAEGGLEMGIKESLVAKPCCAAAYLRGAFWAAASCRPHGDFHFEITVEARRWPRDSWSC